MAEPTQELMLSILQRLQDDNVEIKRDIADIKRDLAEVLLAQHDGREETTYALGMIVTSNRRLEQAHKRSDEVVSRLEKLETE